MKENKAVRFRIPLLTLLLIAMAVGIVIALSFKLPVNSFALDRVTGDPYRPLTFQELLVRLLTFGLLATMVLAGIVLVRREFSRLTRH